jgi:predicted nucleic acid-binding protein
MSLPLLLDTNIRSKIVHPTLNEHEPIVFQIRRLLRDPHFRIYIPEIVDYELRRKLLHLGYRKHQGRKWAREAIANLDELTSLGYLPLTTETMRLAASLWARTRSEGQIRGSEESLDADVILAAQAQQSEGQIVTSNERHFRNLADLFDWRSY